MSDSNLISYFVCEAEGCGSAFPYQYNQEFLNLKLEIPEGEEESYFVSHYGCNYIPTNWTVKSKSKHFVLYKENN